MLVIRLANLLDLKNIVYFVDFWLAGRGIKHKAPGAVNDYFVSPSQHKRYIVKYKTWIVTLDDQIIGWGVIQNGDTLVHLLIAGTHRHFGYGTRLLKAMKPKKIHSKSNQSSGNPEPFYVKLGWKKTSTIKSRRRLDIDDINPDRLPIIDVFEPTKSK